MKQLRSIAVACSLLFTGIGTSYAQSHKMGSGEDNPVQIGTFIVNLGIGVGANYGNYYTGYDAGSGLGLKVAGEVGLFQAGPGVITLGAEIGGSISDGAYAAYGTGNYNSHTIIVAARSAWHYGWNLGGLDTYGGVSAGVAFRHRPSFNANGDEVANNTVAPAIGVFVGASYFFTPGFGVNVEAGYDITNIQAGVVFKIK